MNARARAILVEEARKAREAVELARVLEASAPGDTTSHVRRTYASAWWKSLERLCYAAGVTLPDLPAAPAPVKP